MSASNDCSPIQSGSKCDGGNGQRSYVLEARPVFEGFRTSNHDRSW